MTDLNMSPREQGISNDDANPTNLRTTAIFLFLINTCVGLTFGSVFGALSFAADPLIPIPVFVIISSFMFIIACALAILRSLHYENNLATKRCDIAYRCLVSEAEGSTEWRDYTPLNGPTMNARSRIGIYEIWMRHQMVCVANKIFGHGRPPAAYIEAQMEAGNIESGKDGMEMVDTTYKPRQSLGHVQDKFEPMRTPPRIKPGHSREIFEPVPRQSHDLWTARFAHGYGSNDPRASYEGKRVFRPQGPSQSIETVLAAARDTRKDGIDAQTQPKGSQEPQ